MKKLILAALLALGLCLSCRSMQTNTIQIKGSDTMVNLAQAWAEDYMEKTPGEFIAITGGGSGTGFASLISGTCDIAMSSRDIKARETALAQKRGIKPWGIKVGLDGLAVVVHPQNPVGELSLNQLADIFTGRIANWRDLSGRDMPIVVLSREVNSGTHLYFKEHVLRRGDPLSSQEFAPQALMLSSSQAIAEEVAANPAAIGYFGMGYAAAQHKVVLVAKDEQSEHIAPTLENIMSGRYPISRPLFFYTKGEPQGLVKKFLDYALSPAGQEIVIETDFVPLRQPAAASIVSAGAAG